MMKPVHFLSIAVLFGALAVSGASTNQTSITSVSITGTNILVVGTVSPGLKKVTLQSRQRFDGSAWEPRAILRLDGTGGRVTFRLPKSASAEVLRIQAEANEPLPANFYRGTNAFMGPAGNATATPTVDLTAGGDKNTTTAPTGTAATTAARDVVESDIWKVQGDTLYFFNQYRGLQVIDVANPDHPAILGTLNLPAAGEQMYLLNTNYAVLLAGNGCGYGANDSSQVLVVSVSGGVPTVAASLPVPGWIQESRMVGTALYVVSQSYRPMAGTNANDWEWGSTVSAFDLSVPSKPIVRADLWYPGYGNTIYATDQFLFVASIVYNGNWNQSSVRCIDISSPDGVMNALGTIVTAGQVNDKFKLNMDGDTFTAITARWDDKRHWVTVLQNFSFANPANPRQIGSLELAAGEQLHATRFDGKRVYVVTFFQVDPLWIVDLSDASNPRISGELKVPGWSTYIYPMGDRLLAMGIDNTNSWRAAVSLFDVHDNTAPALLSKVVMGDQYSWSAANYDDKAFGVVPDAGLLLIPYTGDSTNGYVSRVQLIDFTSDKLTARGTINHQFQPLRATLHREHVLSISGKELISVDAADRDNPIVKSDTQLAWTVNRIFLQNGFLLEVDNGNSWSWNGRPAPLINVTKPGDPNTIVASFPFTNALPIVGAVVRDGLLYVAQSDRASFGPIVYLAATGDQVIKTNGMNCHFSILDLHTLPSISVLGESDAAVDPLGWSDLKANWPSPGVLVWSGGGGYFYPMMMGVGTVGIKSPTSIVSGGGGFYWGGGGGGHFLAFDISKPASPKFVSEVNLSTNGWWNYSESFATNGLVYVSHQSSEFIEGLVLPDQPAPTPIVSVVDGKTITNFPPVGSWVQRYYLDVVDYANPAAPTIRKPVNTSGLLKGISMQGAILYTSGQHWTTNATTDWTTWLDANAYDGVASYLVDSMPLPNSWPSPLVLSGDNIFLGRPASDTNSPNLLELWTFSGAGHFALTKAIKVDVAPQTLALVNDLLAGQFKGEIRLLTPDLGFLGSGTISGCFGFDLTQSDGSSRDGLWVPLYDYGVFNVGVKP